uniref:DDE-1 domain-containing protein n=1 Tax=Trichuris muris TaxID=70415 RepID=A0A5S6QLW1_TRIMR
MASNDPHPTSLGLCLPDPFRASDVRLIPQFDGSPSQSVTEWFEKLELVCRLRKVEDVACVVPLRLSGGVFAVYLQLPDEDKKSVVKVKAALLAAFAMDTFAAYDEFSCRKLRNGESPDVFLADLWRLASLFGGIPEKAMMCAFVAGLPESFKHKLYLVMSVQRLCRAYAWVQRRPGRQRTLGSADAMNALRRWKKQSVCMTALNGGALQGHGVATVWLQPTDGPLTQVDAIVSKTKPLDFDFILGMNGMEWKWIAKAVYVSAPEGGRHAQRPGANITLNERDFVVTFDRTERVWKATWKWRDDRGSEVLKKFRRFFDALLSTEISFGQETHYALEGGYDDDFVYNADETGVNWKALPTKSLIARWEECAPGYKRRKKRVTLLCANSSGTHRLPLFVVGKSKNTRSFKNVKLPVTRCGYQKKAWMNVEAFKDWFKTIFMPEVKRHQSLIGKTGKVLLLVDNTPAHPSVQQLDEVDELVTIKFLPPNVTPLIQPMDQGVIQTSKRHYRKQLLRQLLLANEIRWKRSPAFIRK